MSLPEQGTSELVCAAPHVSLHELDGGGVLFDGCGQRLYAFNETATFIWRRIEDAIPASLIVEQMSRDFAIPRELAAEFVDSAFRCWGELSLLGTPGRPTPRHASRPAMDDARRDPREAADGDGMIPARAARTSRTSQEASASPATKGPYYRLFDMPFMMRVADPQIGQAVADFLRPLRSPPTDEPVTVIEIAGAPTGLELSVAGQVVESCDQPSSLLPLIKTCLIELALGRSRGLGAVHAAAVAGPHGTVLLPARSGEGKSTLTAALMAAGFRLLGDDTVALSDTVEARPAPFAICLKEGAWMLLSARFPRLARAPTYRRMDGKAVRYLFPDSSEGVGEPTGRYPIRWVVFPRREPESAVRPAPTARLEPLRKADALTRLTAEFSPLAGGLSEPQVKRLVHWIGGVDCFELRFTNVDEGVEQITRLCGAPHATEFADRH